MCGIFGVIYKESARISAQERAKIFSLLMRLSDSRGKEASGVVARLDGEIAVLKGPLSARMLQGTREYKEFVDRVFDEKRNVVLGHARLVTNGKMAENKNNQPVVRGELVGIHNGIIVNDAQLWEQHTDLSAESEVDTEVLLAIADEQVRGGATLADAVAGAFREIEGSASVAIISSERDTLVLATNTGSLYTLTSKHVTLFASERVILERLLRRFSVLGGKNTSITQVTPGSGRQYSFSPDQSHEFSLEHVTQGTTVVGQRVRRRVVEQSVGRSDKFTAYSPGAFAVHGDQVKTFDREWERLLADVHSLRRCSRCILPETMPFIEFDEDGVCSYCHNYRPQSPIRPKEAEQDLLPYRRSATLPDVVMGFSGGRDSAYGLHYAKKVLGLNPIAFSYDWGMITDLGRRNQARMVGKLGVEHVLISADIAKKRDAIHKNVVAWLKKPDLGMVPLFMAGDKQYFYYAHKLKRETGAGKIILCASPYEKTDFKTGFCGIKPVFNYEKAHYELTTGGKISLAYYYGRNYIKNLKYINSSIFDTLGAYASYYFLPHDHYLLFDHIRWDEKEIEETLSGEYGWEFSPDTRSSWRIVDGTAPVYNYIYFVVAGFTENDTFRSNQIREGVIDRASALQMVEAENLPRYASVAWYFSVINVDMGDALRRIHDMPKLYAR